MDTTPEAQAVQVAIHRRLGPAARLQLAVEMTELVRECALAGFRQRHPECADSELKLAFAREFYGLPPDTR